MAIHSFRRETAAIHASADDTSEPAERDETLRHEKHELIDDVASLPGSANQFVQLELSGVGEHL